MTYRDFIRRKISLSHSSGFEVEDHEIHPLLKLHQRMMVRWGLRGGRRAWFAAFGLGKSVVQLETLRIIIQRLGGRALIVAPLGVRQEFKRDAAMLGYEIRFIRSTEECGETGLYITNYESVRDGKIDPSYFIAVSLDEASVLRGMTSGTATFRSLLQGFENIKYRFVATATPDPNDFIELLAYSAFLGIADPSQIKTRFFKRDAVKADHLTIHPHKQQEFFVWLSTWALFLQSPADICPCACHRRTA